MDLLETMPLSVVIPLAANEMAWHMLVADLGALPKGSEIIFVAPRVANFRDEKILQSLREHFNVRWLESESGRGKQLNMGLRAAKFDFVWFLHADSRLESGAVSKLLGSLARNPYALHYLKLRFQKDGPKLTVLNSLGTRVRSDWFGMPFGDQGFCIRKILAEQIGGFAEDRSYGEDHQFVWDARRYGVRLQAVNAHILTSARKYQTHGWLPITMRHLRLTYWQAFEEWRRSSL